MTASYAAAVELSRVGSVNAPVGSRDPVYNSCAVELLRLAKGDDIMTSLLKKLSKFTVVKPPWSLFGQFANCRELVANSVHTADVDATQLSSCVASAVPIGH